MTWTHSTIAPGGTHHLCEGRPLYAARFADVQKFHPPGLAPASDDTGAFHITPSGTPAYPARFRQTWGFYELLAAVERPNGWFHIRPDGSPLTTERYDWCGNFQEGRCSVRLLNSRYRHIRADGSAAYEQEYLYAGDFRDGASVVRCLQRGLCTHIGRDGKTLHNAWFADLDVFHKGFARARDDRGWFHIDQHGLQVSDRRYAEVEPFYNGQARVLTHSGDYLVINLAGDVMAQVGHSSSAAGVVSHQG